MVVMANVLEETSTLSDEKEEKPKMTNELCCSTPT